MDSEREALRDHDRHLFRISYLLKTGQLDFEDITGIIPGMVHLNSLDDLRLQTLDGRGLDFLKISADEIREKGVALLAELVSPATMGRSIRLLQDFFADRNPHKVRGYFQQIRPKGSDRYDWFFTSTKIFDNENVIAVSHNIADLGSLGKKISRVLEEHEFVKKNFDRFAALTKREVEIVTMVARGKKRNEIADELYISLHTYDNHRKHIREKLGIKSFAEFMEYARAFDLI